MSDNKQDEKSIPKDYKSWYDKGWNYSNNSADPSLEHGDKRGYPDSWYDGYHDASAGRPKYYLYFDRKAPSDVKQHWMFRNWRD